jgi:class 3 adenylate cyclase
VVAGLIGPDERGYGAVGDAVNVARIEEQTKELGATILVSREVADQLGSTFRLGAAAQVSLKGRDDAMAVVEILETRGAGSGAG